VFGEAKIKNGLSDAVDDAFKSLSDSYANKSADFSLLDDTLLDEIVVDENMAELFRKNFIPKHQSAKSNIETEEAFAVFIGYTFTHPSEDGRKPKEQIADKVKSDIESVKQKIIQAIASKDYTANSDFYIYFLPFNDAAADKKSIMQEIAAIKIKGGK